LAAGLYHRQLGSELLIDAGSKLRRADVDRGRPRDHDDRLLERLWKKLDVESQRLIHAQRRPAANEWLVAFLLQPEGIFARWKLRDAVETGLISHRDLLALQIRRRRGHHHICEGAFRRCVNDVAGEHAIALSKCREPDYGDHNTRSSRRSDEAQTLHGDPFESGRNGTEGYSAKRANTNSLGTFDIGICHTISSPFAAGTTFDFNRYF